MMLLGEAFDKVARVLGLGYPGGPEVSSRAREGQASYNLPTTKFEDSYDFSFSGIKTAVMNIANKEKERLKINDMCKSFEENVTDVLVTNTLAVARKNNIDKIVLAGGVSANTTLREKLKKSGEKENFKIYLPKLEYCTDNAAMVAAAGIFKYIEGKYEKALDLNAKASMNIED